ncbi:MAG: hypothetical protein JXB18_05220 [Sedimentisphaerales bacterium]|nr:hypothetical protein [Sedimentisphaerales bacterium]
MAMKPSNKKSNPVGLAGSMQTMEPKTIAAVVLVLVMGVLWGRALLRKGPASAQAASTSAAQSQDEVVKPKLQIQPVALSCIPGRHDTIASDLFTTDRWTAFPWTCSQPDAGTPKTSQPDEGQAKPRLSQEAIEQAFTLEAIIKNTQTAPEKACINGTVVLEGSELRAKIQNEVVMATVIAIEANQVRLAWQDYVVELKMPEVESGQ